MSSESFNNAMGALQEIADHVAVPMKGGKHYTMVKDRIEIFRREFGDEFGIITELDYREGFSQGAPIIAHATISHRDGFVVATGWAVEYVGSTKLTDASPVEVAETSAIGRALACFGLHGGEYASLNEIEAHVRKEDFRQEAPPPNPFKHELPPRNQPRTERQPSGQWYVPSDHDALWIKPEAECNNIINQIEEIGTTHELGHYWSDLKPILAIWKTDPAGKDIIAEIKAAFATRNNALGGQR